MCKTKVDLRAESMHLFKLEDSFGMNDKIKHLTGAKKVFVSEALTFRP